MNKGSKHYRLCHKLSDIATTTSLISTNKLQQLLWGFVNPFGADSQKYSIPLNATEFNSINSMSFPFVHTLNINAYPSNSHSPVHIGKKIYWARHDHTNRGNKLRTLLPGRTLPLRTYRHQGTLTAVFVITAGAAASLSPILTTALYSLAAHSLTSLAAPIKRDNHPHQTHALVVATTFLPFRPR